MAQEARAEAREGEAADEEEGSAQGGGLEDGDEGSVAVVFSQEPERGQELVHEAG